MWRRFVDWWNGADLATSEQTIIGGSDVAQVSDLPPSVAAAFGINTDTDRVTRRQAMSIPTVSQGRDQVAGIIGTFPLAAAAEHGARPVDHPFLAQPDPQASRQHIVTWTVDDLMFHGISWWQVDRSRRDRFPVSAQRLTPGRVTVERGIVRLDGAQVDPATLMRFDGPHEGILRKGATALRTALLLEAAARKYARAETPSGLLRDTRPANVGNELTDEEIDELLAKWRAARDRYGTAYLNRAIEYVTPDLWAPKDMQLVEARQHSALEIARLMGLDANAVSAPAASGMTYVNGMEQRRSRLDYSLRQYMEPITQRLGMDDVTPRGHAVHFDVATWLLGDASERVATAVAATGGPVMTRDEARRIYLDLPPATDDPDGQELP